MTEFTILTAKNILNERREYPINFDHLLKWCNIKSRQQAINLLSAHFEYDLDYVTLAESLVIPNSINLRLLASVEFATMCKTEDGREYKRILIEAERELGVFNNAHFNERDKITLSRNAKDILDLKSVVHDLTQNLAVINHRLDVQVIKNKERLETTEVIESKPESSIVIRDKLISLVNTYANENYKNTDEERFRAVWSKVHKAFFKATRVDLRKRSKAHKPEISGVQYAYQYRMIEILYTVATEALQ